MRWHRILSLTLVLMCFGCGVKGPPLPPEDRPEPQESDVSTQVVKKPARSQ